MTLTELSELIAAVTRLTYGTIRKKEDYDMLIAFIERMYKKKERENNAD